jgi:hypothetical protein
LKKSKGGVTGEPALTEQRAIASFSHPSLLPSVAAVKWMIPTCVFGFGLLSVMKMSPDSEKNTTGPLLQMKITSNDV